MKRLDLVLVFACAGGALLFSGCQSTRDDLSSGLSSLADKIRLTGSWKDVELISDKDNTQFSMRIGNETASTPLGTGRFLKARVPSSGGFEISAKAPGYKLKSYTLTEPINPIRFVFLEEEKVLTIKSPVEKTQFRVRKAGAGSRWLPVGEGKVVEYWVPREGQYEVEAKAPGFAAQVLPIFDRTGELAFADFIAERDLELISNVDYTRFLLRNVGTGDDTWEQLGVGRSLKIKAPAAGRFEISAKPPYYQEKQHTVQEPVPELKFEFKDEDKITVQSTKPPLMRGELPPRPPTIAGILPPNELSKISGKQAWRALLIGISNYSAAGQRSLETPLNDIYELKDLLMTNYGFKSVAAITDQQATRDGIKKALTALHKNTGKGDNVLIYYAGHGIRTEIGEGEWICADGQTLANSEIVNGYMSKSPAMRVLLINDSCFAGAFLTRDTFIEYDPDFTKPIVDSVVIEKTKEISARMVANDFTSRQVLTSTQLYPGPDSGSGPCATHSPFSCQLLRALEAVPKGAPLSATELHTYIVTTLKKQGAKEDNLPQLGFVAGDSRGQFYLLRQN